MEIINVSTSQIVWETLIEDGKVQKQELCKFTLFCKKRKTYSIKKNKTKHYAQVIKYTVEECSVFEHGNRCTHKRKRRRWCEDGGRDRGDVATGQGVPEVEKEARTYAPLDIRSKCGSAFTLVWAHQYWLWTPDPKEIGFCYFQATQFLVICCSSHKKLKDILELSTEKNNGRETCRLHPMQI